MKKTLVLATLLVLGATTIANAGEVQKCGCGCPPPNGDRPCMQKPGEFKHPSKVNLDEKLNLTDAQKAKAKEIRMQGREEMEPIMNAIKTKHEQKKLVKDSTDITTEAKLEQIEKLNNQINELHKQARDLRLKNQKEFEAILTPAQKKQLEQIKTEAKKKAVEKKKAAASDKKAAPTK